MFRSTTFRLAAIYTALFACAVVLLGIVTLLTTRTTLTQQFDARIRAESEALNREFRIEGFEGLLRAVQQRDRTPGALNYGLETSSGQRLAGRLTGAGAGPGWQTLTIPEPDGDAEHVRVYAATLPGGMRLLVGDDVERMEAVDEAIVRAFIWAFVGVVMLGVTAGYLLSRDVHRRLTSISATAEGIIDGDLSRRVPLRASDDDLSRLSQTINRMLDRIQGLMESLKLVSDDIAHDLRTPLTRLRQSLEFALTRTREDEPRKLIEASLLELDAALETFAALLRIAQIEGGSRKSGFGPVDLAEVATLVVEAFGPSAEDGGRTLSLAAHPAWIEGDRELLVQAAVNLVENALRHTPRGSVLEVRAGHNAQAAVLEIVDDGPGAPEEELVRLSDRFYRLEQSRSTPGNGLGLALVAAIARLHGADLTLSNRSPGLSARLTFPPVQSLDFGAAP